MDTQISYHTKSLPHLLLVVRVAKPLKTPSPKFTIPKNKIFRPNCLEYLKFQEAAARPMITMMTMMKKYCKNPQNMCCVIARCSFIMSRSFAGVNEKPEYVEDTTWSSNWRKKGYRTCAAAKNAEKKPPPKLPPPTHQPLPSYAIYTIRSYIYKSFRVCIRLVLTRMLGRMSRFKHKPPLVSCHWHISTRA